MPVYTQLGRRPIQDVPCHNYGTVDIPAGTAVLFDLVNNDPTLSPGVVVPTAGSAMTPCAGITIDTIPAGRSGKLAIKGTAHPTAEGTIALGDWVGISSTAGKMGRVKSGPAAGAQLGRALTAAVDGDPVEVDINITKSA